MTGTRICIIGASSGPGAALALRLLKEGRAVSGVGRNKKKMLGFDRLAKSKFGQSIQWHEIDLKDKELLAPVLEGIEIVVDCADPHYSPSIVGNLSSTVRKYVLLGSARAFSLVPDRRAEDCRVAERAVRESGVTWTVLHPTVIYGGEGGGGAIDRLVSLVRRWEIIPLPRGGRALMQPILIDDVVSSLAAALDRSEAESKTIVLAGPRAMWLSDVVRICARLLERRVTVLPIPLWIARGLAGLARFFPGFPHVSDGEILRLCEDKAFSVEPMRSCLGVTPMPFEEGLKLILDQSATKKR